MPQKRGNKGEGSTHKGPKKVGAAAVMELLHDTEEPAPAPALALKHHRHRYTRSLYQTANNTVDPVTYITNLSSQQLTHTQNKILSLGLKFVPSRRLDQEHVEQALLNFKRSNRLKYFFRDRPTQTQHPFKPKSQWQPPKASPQIESYLERISTSIINQPPINISHNLTKAEQSALKQLATDSSITIKNADKGSGIVVEDTQNYIQDGLEHLSDTNIYEEIYSDPTQQLTTSINKYVAILHNKGIIDSITKEYLTFKNNTSRTQQLYFLKKIHKNPNSRQTYSQRLLGTYRKNITASRPTPTATCPTSKVIH